jgi:6-phosphogluconolactonase (cycloisomerase 2 family)
MSFITGLTDPTGIAISGNSIYIGCATNGNLYTYDLSGALENTRAGFLGSYNYSLAVYNNSTMFATRLYNGNLATINLTNNPYTITSSPGASNSFALAISGNYMYVSNQVPSNYSISQIDLTANPVNYTLWVVNLTYKPYYITIYGDYLYISNQDDNSISCIQLSTQTLYERIITNLAQPSGITTNYNYLFIANGTTGDVNQYDITSPIVPSLVNFSVANVGSSLINLASYNNILYAVNYNSGNVYSFASPVPPIPPIPPIPPTPPIPISNICFLGNTPINTNKGIIPISHINSNIHTIANKKIVAITKTILQDKYLVCFKKNSLGINCPIKNTIMSKNHKILYKGEMMEAHKFLGNVLNVTKIKYNGEILYNILMENYETILVNNLICETLCPTNVIAKLYTSNISENYKNKIIVLMNNSIIKNDYLSYKKIIARL